MKCGPKTQLNEKLNHELSANFCYKNEKAR